MVNGKQSFEEELRRIGVAPSLINNDTLQPLLLKKLSFTNMDDMYAAIGYGGLTAVKAVNRIKDEILRFSEEGGRRGCRWKSQGSHVHQL